MVGKVPYLSCHVTIKMSAVGSTYFIQAVESCSQSGPKAQLFRMQINRPVIPMVPETEQSAIGS
jgi:hypothetical protein